MSSSHSETLFAAQPNTRVRINGIYDDYRKAFMNRLYYECRVKRLQQINLGYEIILAVGTSGTIAAWYLWETPFGKRAWLIFAGAVAVLSILKPILKIPEKIEKLSKLQIGYTELFYELGKWKRAMEENNGLTLDVLEGAAAAQERYRRLAIEDEIPKNKLLTNCFEEVRKKTPAFNDWYQKYIG